MSEGKAEDKNGGGKPVRVFIQGGLVGEVNERAQTYSVMMSPRFGEKGVYDTLADALPPKRVIYKFIFGLPAGKCSIHDLDRVFGAGVFVHVSPLSDGVYVVVPSPSGEASAPKGDDA